MTQEEKQILLKDLSLRLPHGVICHTEEGDGHLCSINQTIFGTEYGLNISPIKRDYFNDSEQDKVVIKPYLRPMSSMSRDEEIEWLTITLGGTDWLLIDNFDKAIDWLFAHHFDFRGLIPMGLALEAKEGMYES